MLNKLPPRERQIIGLLYEHEQMTVAELREALPDRLSDSAIRAMLTRLQGKGLVRREATDRGFAYRPAVSQTVARNGALRDLVRVFFNGSAATAASALLGMTDRLDQEELAELENMLARARAAKEAG